jgi:hypothetical protein
MILGAITYDLEHAWPILAAAVVVAMAIIIGALIVRSGKI